RGDTAGLLWPVLGVALLGSAEAGLFYFRRKVLARPTTHIEAQMRRDLYAHLQRLPVAFHDRWQSGQLLSRAVTDLSTIRGFIAFVAIFLVVHSLTLIGGLIVLFSLNFWLGLT
ncbi:ABC transporter ATP-binding protein, partial [Bacillus paralicheniformis]|nr:ABC transporter ATP-binding protein [Bacillus paralicheniformis]